MSSSADLERSGLFKPIDPKAFIEDAATATVQPRFGDWRRSMPRRWSPAASNRAQDGRLRVEFRLWDVFAEHQLTGRPINADAAELAAHRPHDRRCDL